MSNSVVPATYHAIIVDVIENIRRDFEETGISEEVLSALQRSWEHKVVSSRVANFSVAEAGSLASYLAAPQDNGYNPDIGVKAEPGVDPVYGSTEQYYGQDPASLSNMMSPSRPGLMLPGGGRPAHRIPQNDGADDFAPENETLHKDMSTEQIDAFIHKRLSQSAKPSQDFVLDLEPASSQSSVLPSGVSLSKFISKSKQKVRRKSRHILQHDGPAADDDDDEDDEESEEDDDTNGPSILRRNGAASRNGIKPEGGDHAGADSDEINSDLDDSDEDDNDVEGSDSVEHIVLCLYDKVTRTKNKWKCVLKDGVVLINGKDYLFQKASGDFEW